MKLSIVIPCTDTKGALSSLQSLMLHHGDIAKSSEILVVGPRDANKWLAEYTDHSPYCRFIDFDVEPTSARLINAAVSMAYYQHILCVQPYCLLEPGSIDLLIDFYNFNYDSNDLFQGPMVHNSKSVLCTKPWKCHDMFEDISDAVDRDLPFKIDVQDLGVFSCRRDAWPGTNGLFKVFDGSGYVHDKFRKRDSVCICLPWLKWSKSPVIPIFHIDDQIRDFALWYTEMGHDPRCMLDQIDAEYHEAVPIVERARCDHRIVPIHYPMIAHGHGHLISCVTVVGDASDRALNECVESFRRQIYPVRELIIINDRSDRPISIDMPFVKVVDIPDFSLDDILSVAAGDIICMWPPDRVPYPTKLSVMLSNLVGGCAWSSKCVNLYSPVRLPPVFMFSRSVFVSVASNFATFIDIADKFAKSEYEVCMIQDLVGDTTFNSEEGRKYYHLIPFWDNPDYCERAADFGRGRPKHNTIVVFLLMHNLLEWPKAIINKLKEFKDLHVVLVDQGSTYQPLLDFYGVCDLDIRKLPMPISRIDFINSGIIREFCNERDFFVVLDNDIDICDLPDDTMDVMIETIYDYGGPAAGLAIESSDREHDCRPCYWDSRDCALFPFTMYRMGTKINGVPQKSVDGDYVVRHLPWELDVANGLSEELLYYAKQQLIFNRSADPRLIDAYIGLVDNPGDDS